MELRIYLDVLWRRKWVIAVAVVVIVTAVFIGTLMIAPSYEALSTIRVAMAASGPISYSDYMYAERRMNTYTELATSGPMLEKLAQKLGDRVPAQIEVKIIPNTELLNIVVEDVDPVLASNAANALAEILVAQSKELYASGAKTAYEILGEQLAQIEQELSEAQAEYETLVLQVPDDSERLESLKRSIGLRQQTYATLLQQYENARATEAIRANALSVVEAAKPPRSPNNPRMILNIALGCMVGAAGGVGLAFLFENIDTRLHTVDEIEEVTDTAALGRIPHVRRGPPNIYLNGNSPQREAFGHLRTNIYAAAQGRALQTLLVTSAEPHEGKSTIVTNLAVAMAQIGHRVVAVDGDLRRPALHAKFNLPNRVGLTSVLKSDFRLQEAVQDTEISGVSVLTSGPLLSSPAELLASPKMEALLKEMRRHFDMILVDTPALLPVTDAAVLAPMADGVLLVVRRAHSGRENIQSACQELTGLGAKLLGLVVNGANQSLGHRYYHYYRLPEEAPWHDPLTRIDGIGPVYEKALNALGIVSFAQLARQDPETLAERMVARITAKRICRDQWVEQAQAFLQARER